MRLLTLFTIPLLASLTLAGQCRIIVGALKPTKDEPAKVVLDRDPYAIFWAKFLPNGSPDHDNFQAFTLEKQVIVRAARTGPIKEANIGFTYTTDGRVEKFVAYHLSQGEVCHFNLPSDFPTQSNFATYTEEPDFDQVAVW